MMSKKNRELLTEVMVSIYAKDALEKIEILIDESDSVVIEKDKIRKIIEQSTRQSLFE